MKLHLLVMLVLIFGWLSILLFQYPNFSKLKTLFSQFSPWFHNFFVLRILLFHILCKVKEIRWFPLLWCTEYIQKKDILKKKKF